MVFPKKYGFQCILYHKCSNVVTSQKIFCILELEPSNGLTWILLIVSNGPSLLLLLEMCLQVTSEKL